VTDPVIEEEDDEGRKVDWSTWVVILPVMEDEAGGLGTVTVPVMEDMMGRMGGGLGFGFDLSFR
jgi:hypothetical protein